LLKRHCLKSRQLVRLLEEGCIKLDNESLS
jgi:hypothetical protein